MIHLGCLFGPCLLFGFGSYRVRSQLRWYYEQGQGYESGDCTPHVRGPLLLYAKPSSQLVKPFLAFAGFDSGYG